MKWCTFFFTVLPIAALGQMAAPDKAGPMIANLKAGIIYAPPTVGTSPAPNTIAGTTHFFNEEP